MAVFRNYRDTYVVTTRCGHEDKDYTLYQAMKTGIEERFICNACMDKYGERYEDDWKDTIEEAYEDVTQST